MKRRHLLEFCVVVICAVLFSACGSAEQPAPPASGEAALKVFVTLPPQAFLVKRVGGDHVAVSILVRPGSNPHTYEPTPTQMTGLAHADVYFLVGVPFEEVLKSRIQSANPRMQMVNTGQGVELRAMEAGAEHEHHDGDDHEAEAEGEKDPHTWLSPLNAQVMARNVADALIELDGAHADDYRGNLEALLADLTVLDADIRAACKDLKTRQFMVFHPAFGYFADAYGLKQIPIEIEGKEPTGKSLAALIASARQDGIKVIFVEPQFSRKSAEVVAQEIGGRVVAVDPLAEDYIQNMKQVASAFAEAMR